MPIMVNPTSLRCLTAHLGKVPASYTAGSKEQAGSSAVKAIREVVQPLTHKRKSKDQMPSDSLIIDKMKSEIQTFLKFASRSIFPHWIINWILIYEFRFIRDTYLRIKSSIFEDIVDNSSKKIQPTWIKTDKKTIPSARISSPKGSCSLVCQF